MIGFRSSDHVSEMEKEVAGHRQKKEQMQQENTELLKKVTNLQAQVLQLESTNSKLKQLKTNSKFL